MDFSVLPTSEERNTFLQTDIYSHFKDLTEGSVRIFQQCIATRGDTEKFGHDHTGYHCHHSWHSPNIKASQVIPSFQTQQNQP